MANANVPMFPQTVNCPLTQLTTASEATIFTAGTAGSKVDSILVASTDTSARDVQIFLKSGSTDIQLGTVSIPATAGTADNVPTVNLLASAQFPVNYDAQGNHYIIVPASGNIRIALSGITAAKVFNFSVQGGDF